MKLLPLLFRLLATSKGDASPGRLSSLGALVVALVAAFGGGSMAQPVKLALISAGMVLYGLWVFSAHRTEQHRVAGASTVAAAKAASGAAPAIDVQDVAHQVLAHIGAQMGGLDTGAMAPPPPPPPPANVAGY